MNPWSSEPKRTPRCECALDECVCNGAHDVPARVYVAAASNPNSDPPSFFCYACADRAVLLGDAVYTDIDGKPLEGDELRVQLDRWYYSKIRTGQGLGVNLFQRAVDGASLEARLVLVCSSTHVSAQDFKFLQNECNLAGAEGIDCKPDEFSVQVRVEPDADGTWDISESTHLSTAFWELVKFARTRGFDRVEIDVDGPTILGLPTFER